ncbi:MAG: NADH-quinone oxidoreductase subunit M [Syntrophorhabdales bacterium]|jgi:NADH-quinone oxidoreductase subunit M
MILAAILFVPTLGGIAAWLAGFWSPRLPRWVSLAALVLDFILVVALWLASPGLAAKGAWIASFRAPWIPPLGASFHLGMDGISLILSALAAFLGCMAIAASWTEITERAGFFYLCLTWTIAGVLGVFLALDLFLFYFAWEFMLVPMYFLIALWGHEDRFRAAVKFIIFTQLSGLLMLASILGLYFIHGRATGTYTFDYPALLYSPVSLRAGLLLQVGFLAAFLVKLPAVPFHTWLPDAHTQAPTAGSVILAGLLLKTGAYGLLRFSIPLFPDAARGIAMPLAILGVIGILYGALLAFGQSDMKRLVAYTSVSHMGFVLLGLLSGSGLAFQGAIIQMVSHGLSTGALFILVGALQDRLGTRDLSRMGGLWAVAPRLGGASMFFVLAGLGLPGMGNFVGEFLVVLGTYRMNAGLAVAAALGFVFSTAYSLRMMDRVFFGENKEGWRIADLSVRELAVMVVMIVPLLGIGLFPQPLLDQVSRGNPSVQADVRGNHSNKGSEGNK